MSTRKHFESTALWVAKFWVEGSVKSAINYADFSAQIFAGQNRRFDPTIFYQRIIQHVKAETKTEDYARVDMQRFRKIQDVKIRVT